MRPGLPAFRIAVDSLPADAPLRVCEVNTKGGAHAAALLRRWPRATFAGLAFRDGKQGPAAVLDPALADRGTVHVGDKLRTIRAAPEIDDCDVMIVDTHDETAAGVAGSKKIVGDMPNVLQRMSTTRPGNVVVMHGPKCTRRGPYSWCIGWDELVQRKLVASLSCVDDAGERWCFGRAATDSACAKRPPLLPSLLPAAPMRARAAHKRSRNGAASPSSQATDRSAATAAAAPTAATSNPAATSLAAAGWRSEEVGGVRLGYWWRYFTVLQGCGKTSLASSTLETARISRSAAAPLEAHVCLIFKNSIFESWIGGITSTDGGRTFETEPTLVMPATWTTARMTHNLAISAVGGAMGGYVIVGGQFKLRGAARCGRRSGNYVPCRPTLPPYNGVWMARGRSWRYMKPGASQIATRTPVEELVRRSERASEAGEVQWEQASWLFNGTHAGCIERRSRFYASMAHLGTCEFDGRLSLVEFQGAWLLYARANPATHGQRYVQVTSSSDGGHTWGRFSFVDISEYDHAQGDVYFFAVSVNPVHNGSLLALFPLAHKFRGCIGMAASIDGVHWSAPTPLLRCAVHGERAVHHPAQGLIRVGETVALYVHENVPGVTSDLTPTAAQMATFPYLKLPRPRLVRHSIPAAVLRSWTLSALRPENMSRGARR